MQGTTEPIERSPELKNQCSRRVHRSGMNRFRNQITHRIISALLAVCLGTVVISPAALASSKDSGYANWLRLHLRDASNPDVQRAIELASEVRARNINEFLVSFISVLDVIQDDFSSGESPDESQKPNERLLQALRFQFTRFVGEAFLMRQLIVAPSQTVVFSKELRMRSNTRDDHGLLRTRFQAGDLLVELEAGILRLEFLRSTMQRLGP